jgi:vancomycin resistance protein YoaR
LALDTAETAARLQAANPKRSAIARVKRAFFGPGQVAWVAPAFRFDQARATTLLTRLAPELYRAPVNAYLDVDLYLRVPDVSGRELDVAATLQQITLDPVGAVEIPLVFRELLARVRSHDLPAVDVGRVLAAFETDFRKKAGPRAKNIRRAAKLLDGALMQPGEVFSFNKVVGERSERNGFTWAPVIVNDELEPGLGGGVCQVASTLHAAAVHAGIDIVSRRSHSRPSGYAPLGLDAVVVYGEVDLQLRNPYSVPLMIHTAFPSQYVIRIELRGMRAPAAFEHRYSVTQKHDYYRRIVENPALPTGQFERTQKGSFGYDVVSVVRPADGLDATFTKRYYSKYHPVPEVYSVGPGTSPDVLPPLPEGATRVQFGRGEEDLSNIAAYPEL